MNGGGRACGKLLLLTGAAVALSVGLSACSPSEPADSAPTASRRPDATAGPSAPAPDPAPTLRPGGGAEQNLDYFDWVNERVVQADGEPDGRAFIDGLIAAGFDRAAMEVTPDRTAVDLAADSIQFSVRIGDECLLGQWGGTGYASHVTGVLSTGRCLVGRTRHIDW